MTRRELVSAKNDNRCVQRDDLGQLQEWDGVGHALSQNRCKRAITRVTSGPGDRGGQRRH